MSGRERAGEIDDDALSVGNAPVIVTQGRNQRESGEGARSSWSTRRGFGVDIARVFTSPARRECADVCSATRIPLSSSPTRDAAVDPAAFGIVA